jgi:oligopeptide/dipeptide ABC transporter ATP-binding protein
VVEHISNRVAVMYLGKIVEIAPTKDLYANPAHPYAKALLSAVPVPDPKVKRERVIIKGDVASPIDAGEGCRFYARCPLRRPACATNPQVLVETAPGHLVVCEVQTGVTARNDHR